MAFRFIADENVPLQVVLVLREAGYDVATIGEVARPGIRNDDLASLSAELNKVIITRDADFTRLRRSLAGKVKVIHMRLGGDPNSVARQVLGNIEDCLKILEDRNLTVLDEEGCQS